MADTWEINTNRITNAIVQDNTRQQSSSLLKSSTVISYPIKRDDVYQGRIRFTVRKAKALNPGTGVNKLLELGIFDNVFGLAGVSRKGKSDEDEIRFNNSVDPGLSAALERQKQIQDSKVEGTELTKTLAEGFKGIKYTLDTTAPIIDLYMPAGNIVINEGVQYDANANLNPAGMTAMAGLGAGDTLLGAMGKGISEGFKSIFDLGSLDGDTLSRLAVGRLADKIPGGIGAAGQLAVQATANPNTRALFKNVNIREFNFTFKFISTSSTEARAIQEIIRHFRTELYPESIEAAGIPIGYNFPNAFGIQFSYKGKKAKIPKLETCYLRTIQTSYNPTSATFHTDGQPSEIDLTLNFVEIRTLHKKDILGEFG